MGLRLSVRSQAWYDRTRAVAGAMPGLIPVVKGNGYGFGRATLMPIAAELSDTIAVGSVYEAADVPADRVAMVLTPHLGLLPDELRPNSILTVGAFEHAQALDANGWSGNVVIKLRSSMQRHGIVPNRLESLSKALATSRCELVGYSLHLPLVGSQTDHVAEIEAWLPHLDTNLPLSLSHLDDVSLAGLRTDHPQRSFTIRSGTFLWHGDKSLLHLDADVLDVHAVHAGTRAGYRATIVPDNGHLALVAAGSAHGVHPLDDGRSPFHFGHRRLTLLEPPHMHTSMVFVDEHQACPSIGDRVDVQRPLTMTVVDELMWIDD